MSKVFVTRRIPEAGLERLRAKFEVDVWQESLPPSRSELLSRVVGCAGILSLLSDRIDGEVMDAAGANLKAIANFAVGYNNIDVAAARARGITVGNTPDALTDATADIAVGLLIAAARDFRAGIHNVERLEWKSWEPLGFLGQDLAGKTLGIVGMGRIGAAVARRLRGGWGMRVLYTSRTPKPQYDAELGSQRVSLEELLSQSDFVSVHANLTDETRNLFGAKEFALMKSNSVFVNTARGEVVDQHALWQALSSKQIFAAGLDVTTPEPIAPDSPLRDLSNCVILPHIGSATIQARNQMARMAADNLIESIEGRSMPHPVA